MRVLGIMSGTSLDGVDVALCEFAAGPESDGELTLRLLGYREMPFPPARRAELLHLFRHPTVDLGALSALNVQLGHVFADAAENALGDLGPAGEIDLVASHGQTLFHAASCAAGPSTLQMGEPSVIAHRLGCTVVADFRVADIAAGGQGAPLVSYFDAAFFRDPERTRAIQNIGGIANVTFVPAGSSNDALCAFDTGPGNALIDCGARVFSGGANHYDPDGAMAAAGVPDDDVLAEALAHPYFSQPPPKTSGREVFGDACAGRLIDQAQGRGLRPPDIMAILTALTAESIARSYRAFGPPRVHDVVVSGGGARNKTLMRRLQDLLPECDVHTLDAFGLPVEAKEAVAFALLGYEALHGWPANIPRCTGARSPAILGKIVPGTNYRPLMASVHHVHASTPSSRSSQEGPGSPCLPTRTLRLLP
ncbi:MAG: anhydro-N-acetylmuramic acid kinase [Chloroflexota bacterium]